MKTFLELLPTAVFAIVMLCWVAFAAIIVFRKKIQQASDKTRDRSSIVGLALQCFSYAIVWGLHRASFTTIVPERASETLALQSPYDQWIEVLIAMIAIAAAVGSVLLIRAAVKTLGKEWSITARMVQNHKLAHEGPYARVRHPIYTGMLGMLVASGLAVSNFIGLFAAIVVFAIGTWIRVRIEERLLRETFGQRFEEYAREVPAIIPGIL